MQQTQRAIVMFSAAFSIRYFCTSQLLVLKQKLLLISMVSSLILSSVVQVAVLTSADLFHHLWVKSSEERLIITSSLLSQHHAQALQEVSLYMTSVILVRFAHFLRCIHSAVDLFHQLTTQVVCVIMV